MKPNPINPNFFLFSQTSVKQVLITPHFFHIVFREGRKSWIDEVFSEKKVKKVHVGCRDPDFFHTSFSEKSHWLTSACFRKKSEGIVFRHIDVEI